MSVFLAKIAFTLVCLAVGVSSTIVFNKAAAMPPGPVLKQNNVTSYAPSASEPKGDKDTHNTLEPKQVNSTSHMANASKSKRNNTDILTKIERERSHVLNSSATAIKRLNYARTEMRAALLEAKSAETAQAAVAKRLEEGTAKVRSAKERRLEVTTQDMDSIASLAALNRSRNTLAKAQALVASAEDDLVALTLKSHAADREMRRTKTKLELALKARNHTSRLAKAVHRHIMNFGKAVTRAREHRAHLEAEMGSAAAEMQVLAAKLRDALQTKGAMTGLNRSAPVQPAVDLSAAKNPSQTGSGETAAYADAEEWSFTYMDDVGGNASSQA